MLCRDQEALRNMAATDSHHMSTGDRKKSQKPCQSPMSSSSKINLDVLAETRGAQSLFVLTLCNKTPRLMLASVMKDSITSEPTSKPWAHASRIRASGLEGFCLVSPRSISLGMGLMVVAVAVAEFSKIGAGCAEE
jgi:hypothetical protein